MASDGMNPIGLLHNTFHDIDDIKVDNLVVKERW